MNGFIRAASYSRVSSQRQADEKTIESQLFDIRARTARDQIKIDSSFEYNDDGYSGAELQRPALERLRDHIAASMIDRLYVHSPDRLARDFAHQAILLEEMAKHTCEVVFLNQEGLPDSPETKMLIQMQGMFAEYERAKIMERTRRGRRYSAAQGKVSVFGRAPYGYTYIRKSAGQSEARWEIEPTESAAVQLMFEGVAQRGLSLASVCRELKSRGIRTRNGKEDWHAATVRGILINPAYYGQAHYGKERLSLRKPGRRAKRGDPTVPRQAKVAVATPIEEQVIIRVPAIVSQTVFEEVRQRMNENRKQQRARHSGVKYLLSGLLICGKCGSAYCHHGGSRSHYYRCIGTDKHRRNGATICDNSVVKGAELEACVWSDLCQLLNEPARVKLEYQRRQADAPENSEGLAKQQAAVKGLRSQLDRLIDAYAQGLIERSEFEGRIGSVRSRHDRETATLASMQSKREATSDPEAAEATLSALASEVNTKLSDASFELKRNLIKLLIKRIEICTDEIRIVYKVPPNPFVPSPDNRGFFQHWLSRHAKAWDASPRWKYAHATWSRRATECVVDQRWLTATLLCTCWQPNAIW
jgi:site-specific DNA recombinase